jgi:hypothetical protein
MKTAESPNLKSTTLPDCGEGHSLTDVHSGAIINPTIKMVGSASEPL